MLVKKLIVSLMASATIGVPAYQAAGGDPSAEGNGEAQIEVQADGPEFEQPEPVGTGPEAPKDERPEAEKPDADRPDLDEEGDESEEGDNPSAPGTPEGPEGSDVPAEAEGNGRASGSAGGHTVDTDSGEAEETQAGDSDDPGSVSAEGEADASFQVGQ